MKLSKLQELNSLLEKRAVLQHFVDSAPGSLYIGMTDVQNQIGLHKELDMKVRILLAVQIDKMEEEMKASGIDMSPEKKEPEKKAPESPPEGVIDATASEPGEESKKPAAPEESSGADEEGSPG